MRKWYNNGTQNILREESSAIPEGFVPGRCNVKVDRSKLATAKGKKWYSNGEIEKLLSADDEVPDGFVPGRSRWYWITDGIHETRIRDLANIPEGWYQGVTEAHVQHHVETFLKNYKKENHPMYGKHHSEETRKKISVSETGENHWAWGIKQSKETIEKKRAALKEYYKHNPVSQEKRDLIASRNSNPSAETRDKMSRSAIFRIIENGVSCKGKAGWYKGYHCMSSWELAYVIYNLEHDIPFKQNKEWFEYTYNDKVCRYLPDFIEGDTYIEIKGFYDDRTQPKIDQFPSTLKLKVLEKLDVQIYLQYVIDKYGKDFTYLYEQRAAEDLTVGKLVNSEELD